MTRHPSKLVGCALLLLALAGAAHAAPGYPPLTPERNRITDPAVAADLAAFAALERRIAALGDTADAERTHARALAAGWLVLARDQYRRNDRSGLAEAAYARAGNLVVALENGSNVPVRAPSVVPGSIRLREDLWRLADSLRREPSLTCVAEPLARLELNLVRAGHEHVVCRATDPHPLRESLGAQALRVREAAVACTPPVAIAEESVPVPAPMPEPSALPEPMAKALHRLGALNNVHFDLNADTLSRASQAVLDSVAFVMTAVPEIHATLYGHTDPRGSAAYNLALGRRRCAAVVAYLAHAGIDSQRLAIVSRGFAAPVATGAGARDHALNRRVEIHYQGAEGLSLDVRRQEDDLQIEAPRPAAPRESKDPAGR